MPESSSAVPKLPPEVAAYLRGPTDESLQFDFLIGGWRVDGRRHGPDGEMPYAGRWQAQYLHGKRMVMDDFTVLAPSDDEVSAFVTLRTFSPLTGRWEIAGMPAMQPGVNGKWFGHHVDGEMHLEAEVVGPGGHPMKSRIRFYAIEPQRFQWENHVSIDGGATWKKVASLVATRTGP
jgi:hypothetical protein